MKITLLTVILNLKHYSLMSCVENMSKKNVFVHNRQMKMISLKFVAPIQAASSTKFSVPLAGALWSVTSLSLFNLHLLQHQLHPTPLLQHCSVERCSVNHSTHCKPMIWTIAVKWEKMEIRSCRKRIKVTWGIPVIPSFLKFHPSNLNKLRCHGNGIGII